MQYMLLLNETEGEFAKRNHPEHAETYWGGWNAFIGAMAQAGIIVNGDGLHGPQTATTVRVRDGKRLVQDVAERAIDDALIAATVEGIAEIRASDEGREGVASFLQKRKPAWLAG